MVFYRRVNIVVFGEDGVTEQWSDRRKIFNWSNHHFI